MKGHAHILKWLSIFITGSKIESYCRAYMSGADPGFLKGGGGVQIRSTSKKRGGRRGSDFGPNVKKPTSWHKRGVRTPWTPPPSLDPLLHVMRLLFGEPTAWLIECDGFGLVVGGGGGESFFFFFLEWGVYALSASKAIFRARTYNCITYSVRWFISES